MDEAVSTATEKEASLPPSSSTPEDPHSQNATIEPTAEVTEQVIITSVPGKATTATLRGKPSIASLAGTSSDEVKGTLIKIDDLPRSQMEGKQLIDILMDSNLLQFEDIAALCLMRSQDKFASLTEDTEGLQDAVEALSKKTLATDDTLLEEVHKVLENEDFSIVKARYVEMIACLPENYEATIGTLQNQLSNSDICEILTLTSGHNQKILNCLILKLRSKEDLFDFCESLEKINGAHALLQQITEQIRKDVIEEKSNLVNAHDIMAYEAALKDGSECSNQFKLVTLGAEGAGKTSSINTLLNLPFQANQNSTIGASVNSCSVDTHLASSKWKKITALYRESEIRKQYRRELKVAMSSVPANPVTPAAPVRPVSQKVINEVKSMVASKEELPQDGHIRIVIFDIGGQEVYYDVHFLFLAIEDVVLLAFDCSKGLDDPVISRHRTGNFGEKIATRGMQSNIDTIELLLHSVYSRGQKAPVGSISLRVPVVIMLGTHAENVSTEIQELIIQTIYQRFYGKPFLEHLPQSKNEAFHFLGNSNPNPKSVNHLRSTVLKAADLVISTKRPISYLKFEGKMLEKMQQAQVRLSRADAVNIARDAGIEGEQAVDALLRYFTNKGILLYYPEVTSLKNEIFISPQEVSDLVCTVIATHEYKPGTAELQQSYCRYSQYALLEEELLVFILQQSKRLKDRKVLLGLLDKFNLVTEVPANTIFSHEINTTRNREYKLFIVPSLLVYDNKVPYHKQDGDIVVQYYFPDGFLPESIFNQLLVKTIQWCGKHKHIVRCIRRGVGYFSFDDARWQQFQLQLCQSTSSINCYITIQRFHQPPSDMLFILLQQRQQLLIHLKSSIDEVTKCCMPTAKSPVTHLECPLHEEDCTPHVVINVRKRDVLVCHEKLLATPIPEEFYILLYQETIEACLLTKLLKQKPKMSQLLKSVIPKVATHWDTLAFYLDFEISSVELIKEKCFNDPEKCCKEVFIRWLNSKEGISPKTWEVVLNVLKEITDLTAVYEQIEKELNGR